MDETIATVSPGGKMLGGSRCIAVVVAQQGGVDGLRMIDILNDEHKSSATT